MFNWWGNSLAAPLLWSQVWVGITITAQWIAITMLNCKINGTVHIFFLKKSYLSPQWTKLPQYFFFYGSFPIILSCYKWVLSRLGPLHGQNWQNVSKKCLFGCPKPKSLKMTNIAPFSQATWSKKNEFSQFSIKPNILRVYGKLSKIKVI